MNPQLIENLKALNIWILHAAGWDGPKITLVKPTAEAVLAATDCALINFANVFCSMSVVI